MLLLSISSRNIIKQHQYARQYTNNTKHLIKQSYTLHNYIISYQQNFYLIFFSANGIITRYLLFPLVIFAIYYLLTDISIFFLSLLLKKRFYVLLFFLLPSFPFSFSQDFLSRIISKEIKTAYTTPTTKGIIAKQNNSLIFLLRFLFVFFHINRNPQTRIAKI